MVLEVLESSWFTEPARGIAQAGGTMVDGLEHVELEWLDVDL